MDLIDREKAIEEVFVYDAAPVMLRKMPSAFEGMTNGEVLQAVISNLKPIVLSGKTGAVYFDWDWWNALYKEEKENEAI